jgi:adenylate kinase
MKKGNIIEIEGIERNSILVCTAIFSEESREKGFFLIGDNTNSDDINVLGYRYLDKTSDLINSISHLDQNQFYTSIKYDTLQIPLQILSNNYKVVGSTNLHPDFYPRPNYRRTIQNIQEIESVVKDRLSKKGIVGSIDKTEYNSYPLSEIQDNQTMKIIIITGPPYSGKGTQCDELVKEYELAHISTGEHIRKEKDTKSELGKIMSDYDVKGELVPDEIMKRLLKKLIKEHENNSGIILDGYPRTIPQVKDLIEVLTERDLSIDTIINIEVPTDELLNRAKKRAETSTREDDKNPETHYKRIRVFEEQTKPTIEYMKKEFTVNTFDGLGTVEEITERIKASM